MRGGGRSSGVVFDAEQELRADQEALNRSLNPDLESALGLARFKKGHQRTDVGHVDRTAISASFQGQKNFLRARPFLGRRRRMTHKDAAARRRVARARRM